MSAPAWFLAGFVTALVCAALIVIVVGVAVWNQIEGGGE